MRNPRFLIGLFLRVLHRNPCSDIADPVLGDSSIQCLKSWSNANELSSGSQAFPSLNGNVSRLNTLMKRVDPSGFRWFNETWLTVDRGVGFYNNEAIPPDRGFMVSRPCFVALGLLAVTLSRQHLAVALRESARRNPGISQNLSRQCRSSGAAGLSGLDAALRL